MESVAASISGFLTTSWAGRPAISKETVMKRTQSQIIKAAMLSAAIVLTAATSLATAGGGRSGPDGGYGGSGYRDSGYREYGYAGKISIDGYTTRINTGRPVLRQIANAFRRAGYNAWIENGCVQVRAGDHRPSVRWYRGSYTTRINWDHGLLSISAQRSHQRYRPRAGHDRPRHRPRRSRGWGWGYSH
jgi:hypothetical protein